MGIQGSGLGTEHALHSKYTPQTNMEPEEAPIAHCYPCKKSYRGSLLVEGPGGGGLAVRLSHVNDL